MENAFTIVSILITIRVYCKHTCIMQLRRDCEDPGLGVEEADLHCREISQERARDERACHAQDL